MKFRPCIDLHRGEVKQIVGATLLDGQPELLQTNFVAQHPPAYFAAMYRQDDLGGGHIIKLGPGNDEAAASALAAWPGGLQIGGGITIDNAPFWLDLGASHVIVTSSVFSEGKIDFDYLFRLVKKIGRRRLVLDLSCRKRNNLYYIVTDRWQHFTTVALSGEVLAKFAESCDEFLIHAADVEGRCEGIELDLVEQLAKWVTIPTTYAGGIRNLDDMKIIKEAGSGRLDATIGSALDIFGGTGVRYVDVVAFHNACRYQQQT